MPGTFDDPAAFDLLAETVHGLEQQRGTGGNLAFYLSIPPGNFAAGLRAARSGPDSPTPTGDAGAGSSSRSRSATTSRAPASSTTSSDRSSRSDSVFRIDHYLGKETVQNMLALRFANQMFEPIWNANYVDHVQITMAEDIGIGGRAGYYDGIGAARDVIQNHLLQLLALTAMEEPVSFNARDLRGEKEKVLSAVQVPDDIGRDTARGQYAHGWQGEEEVVGYLEEDGVAKGSTTETYAAVRLEIDTRRWAGVPFYLRTGKRLGKRVTEIAVVFKKAPHLPFDDTATEELGKNAIVIRVQPDEGITMRFGSKVPGNQMEVRDVTMDFGYGTAFTESSPEAYERLILDVLLGDPPLFPRHEEVELSWRILDPIEEWWAKHGKPEPYAAGGWGPASSHEMMAREGRTWRIRDHPDTESRDHRPAQDDHASRSARSWSRCATTSGR